MPTSPVLVGEHRPLFRAFTLRSFGRCLWPGRGVYLEISHLHGHGRGGVSESWLAEDTSVDIVSAGAVIWCCRD